LTKGKKEFIYPLNSIIL